MKTRKAKPVTGEPKAPKPEPRVSAATEAAPEAPDNEVSDDRVNISFYVENGRIDRARIREKTKAKVREWITNPDFFEAFGAPPESAQQTKAPEVFPPSWTGILYDALGKIETVAAIRGLKIEPVIANRVFTYTEAEKETLAKPTADVLNKYATSWMIKFKEEIALFMILGGITMAKLETAKALSEAARESRPKIVKSAPRTEPAPPASQPEPEPEANDAGEDYDPADLLEVLQPQ